MNFLVTTYIYPLAEPLVLSRHLKISLDNPRTRDEVSFLKNHLIRARDSGEDYGLPDYSDENIVTVEETLLSLRDFLGDDDQGFRQRSQDSSREGVLELAASNWVVARYDDEGASQELYELWKQSRAKGERTFFLLDEDHPIEKGQALLSDYSYLLALLVNSERDSYHGRSFLIAEPRPTKVQDKSMWFSLLMLGMMCHDGKDNPFRDDPLSWTFFPLVQEQMLAKSKMLDEAFLAGHSEKLLYVGNLLRLAAEDATNERTRLLVLTSILELLVTHSPDYSRFNVEESIGKQFRLKVALLTYLNNKTLNIDRLGKRLKLIYEQRSNVAHGNFEAINRYVKSLSREEGEEEYFDDLISELYTFVRAVIEQYLIDHSLVDFLKAY